MTAVELARERSYPPPTAFSTAAQVGPAEYARLAAEAEADPVAFWERAAERLQWDERWHTAHTWSPSVPTSDEPGAPLTVPEARWFLGGRLNVAVNCVDRHVAAGRGDKVALHFEGEPGDRRTITYADLQREVSRAANALIDLGIRPGDRVVVYLPVLPETIIITLAIARIGAIHSLVFGGFSAEAVRFRLKDTGAKLLVTSDGQFRRGTATLTKPAADQAADGIETLEHVLVVRRTGDATPDVPWTPGRDVWWHDVVDTADDVHVPESFDSEHPLFIIYTSGTTGQPKGLVHTAGGYLTQASWSHWLHFDARDDDVHWCTADLAWVTAHTYEIYGPLSNGLTQVIYEGTPNAPHEERHLEIIERYGVTTYYTAPTLIRTFMTWFGDDVPSGHDLSSIRLLGSVGESINPEAWAWFHRNFGRGQAPIVDTWWQSETGSTIVGPVPGASTLKPGSATRPSLGVSAIIVDEDGKRVGPGEQGFLVLDRTWPAMARTIWNDPERYRDAYWSRYAAQGWFFAGDGARYDEDGDIWLLGRVDEAINVSGHLLSTIEIESALMTHPWVGEAGVTGVADALTGQAVAAFVVPSVPPGPVDDIVAWHAATMALRAELVAHVAAEIGPIARPRDVFVVPEVPKTRSGKILRRLLAQLVDGAPLGDTTSLQNPWAVDEIAAILRGHPAQAAARPAARPPCTPHCTPRAGRPRGDPHRMTEQNDRRFGFRTRALHAGGIPDAATGARAVPIYQTTSFVFQDTADAANLFALQKYGNIYSRIGNPTVAALEERIASLEGGIGAVATASGMSAEFITFAALVGAGDHIVASAQLYGGTVTQLDVTLRRFGVDTTFVTGTDPADFAAAIRRETKAVYVEVIANPSGEIADLAGLAEVAHAAGVPLVVDSTLATPYLLRPIEHGADIVIHSVTKFLGGHGTTLGGIVVESGRFDWGNGRFPQMTEPVASYGGVSWWANFGEYGFQTKLRSEQLRDIGPALSPQSAFLLLQGVETLPQRMDAHLANARVVAEWLEADPRVTSVSWAGLASHPHHERAAHYLPAGPSAVFAFRLASTAERDGRDVGRQFIEALQLASHLANIGDARTLVIHPASTTHQQLSADQLAAAGVPADLVRISVGIEDVEDILWDLDQALTEASGAHR